MADLKPLLDDLGFQGSVAVQADQSEDETRFLLELSKREPFILGVVGWVDLLGEDLEDRLAHFSGLEGFCGVRHIAQAEADTFLADDEVIARIGCLGGFGLTYDILVYPRQLPAALELVGRLPGQKFVLDHAGNPPIGRPEYRDWETSIAALALRPNLVCKVSGLVNHLRTSSEHKEPIKTLRPVVEYVAHKFGMHRLMFGGDWPVSTLAGFDLPAWATLIREIAGDWSLADQESFFETNAHRVYGIH